MPEKNTLTLLYTAVYPSHPAVKDHKSHRTVQSVEAKREKAEERDRKEKEAEERKKGEIQVIELWKPHATTVPWFVSAEKEYALRSSYENSQESDSLRTFSVLQTFTPLKRSRTPSMHTSLQNS